MKKLFSKKSGFTLVEIVIALAVFSIMASMIAQMLHLTIQRRKSNTQLEKNLQNQEETLITNDTTLHFDEDHGKDGTLVLDFKNKDGQDMPMNLDYQVWAADGTVGDKNGVNRIVGQLQYDGENGEVEYIPDKPGENPTDPSDTGGSSQMSRFDTRITGTKGIRSVMVSYTYDATIGTNGEYTFTVTVDDSGVSSAIKNHSQVTLFFGEGKANAPLLEVAEVNGGTKNADDLKYTKICGANGVNVHCNGDGFNGTPVSFKVKFKTKLDDPNSIAFGSNASGAGTSQTYTAYTDSNGKAYPNIYGAYAKTTTPATPSDPATPAA